MNERETLKYLFLPSTSPFIHSSLLLLLFYTPFNPVFVSPYSLFIPSFWSYLCVSSPRPPFLICIAVLFFGNHPCPSTGVKVKFVLRLLSFLPFDIPFTYFHCIRALSLFFFKSSSLLEVILVSWFYQKLINIFLESLPVALSTHYLLN